MKKRIFSKLFGVLFIISMIIWYGCQIPGKVKQSKKNKTIVKLQLQIDKSKDLYLDYIQPLFDNRCVVCHSCYNSPCQIKLSSYEGVVRGGSKIKVYDGTRLNAIEPTRLFTDARGEKQWREKGFYSVTKEIVGGNSSAMEQLLDHKKNYNEKKDEFHEYHPESEDLICSETQVELNEYMNSNPHMGMPFGFPELTNEEDQLINFWLSLGSPGPSPKRDLLLKNPRNGRIGFNVLRNWEKFFNKQDIKNRITSRYIFEHLFLAHLYFDQIPNEFYELVRSKTDYPKDIDIIATDRPYDDPSTKKFFYRIRKIHSTLVHKTHITYRMDLKRMDRYKELFIDSNWNNSEEISFPSYDPLIASNPFDAFKVIPAKARYQFLLDDSHFFIMNFIRGPVCKGQLALNSINDHFSVFFIDPKHDVYSKSKKFEKEAIPLLKTPIMGKSSFFKGFYYRYHRLEQKYVDLRNDYYEMFNPKGMNFDHIWNGGKRGDPILTIYRHMDSASVLSGQKGGVPKTLWLLDFPLFERIYYTLVAGFNVFGSVSHQLFVREYMDDMRIEGEDNYLSFLPISKRNKVHQHWYHKKEYFHQLYFYWDKHFSSSLRSTHGGLVKTQIKFETEDFNHEFLTKLFNRKFDQGFYRSQDLMNNHPSQNRNLVKLKNEILIKNEKDIDKLFSKVTNQYGLFVSSFPENRLDVVFIRVKREGKSDLPYTLVKNKAHRSVDTLFYEDSNRMPENDTFHIFKGFVGSYPNLFLIVDEKKLNEFIADFTQLSPKNRKFLKFIDKYGVRRLDRDFWEYSDWFNKKIREISPMKAGLFDLNRYANIPPTNYKKKSIYINSLEMVEKAYKDLDIK